MRITFLSDNKTENSACVAEWGLSILIESCGHKVLFDTGASSIFAGNAASMGIRLDQKAYQRKLKILGCDVAV